MAVGIRNSILNGLFVLCLVFGALFAAAGVFFLIDQPQVPEMGFAASQHLWFVYVPLGQAAPALVSGEVTWNFAGCAALFAVSALAFGLYKSLFRKTGLAEVFFLCLFFFTVIFEAFRGLVFFIHWIKAPPELVIQLTRLVYMGRCMCLIAILCASLYALELQYQKFELLTGLMAFVSLALIFPLPVDVNVLLTSGMFKLADELGMFIITGAFKLITLVNYLIAGIRKKQLWLAMSILAILAGREILNFTYSPVLFIPGIVILIGGSAGFYLKIRELHDWM